MKKLVAREPLWPSIAAFADELLVGDPIEADRVEDLVRFWWNQ